MFFILIAPYLWKEIHPIYPIIIIMLFLCTVVFLLLTSCSDPGIIPKKMLIETLYPHLQQYLQPYDEKHPKRKKRYCYTC